MNNKYWKQERLLVVDADVIYSTLIIDLNNDRI